MDKKQKYTVEFKLAVVQAVKNRQFSAEYARLYFGRPYSGIISQWLQSFDKKGISGLFQSSNNET